MSLRTILAGLVLLLPFVIVTGAVVTYAVNLPYWDDYMIQDHLLLLKNTPGTGRKLARLFDQHWEHRIVWTRSLFFLYYKLAGQLNFYGLTLIGVLGLFATVGVLGLAFRRTGLPLFYFLPVPFLLLTLQSHENLIWAMASLQNFYILAFALGAFYLLALGGRPAFLGALALAVMASFTSGNGFLVFASGTVVLLWRRQGIRMLGWLSVGFLCVLGYFANYSRVSFFPSAFLFGFGEWVKAFFVFFGAFLDTFPYTKPYNLGYENPLWLAFLGGLIGVGFALFHLLRLLLTSRTIAERHASGAFWNTFFVGTTLFLLGTAAMTVYARVGFGGAGYLLQGRYKVYSPLFLSVCYLYFVWLYRRSPHLRRNWLVAMLVVVPVSLYADYQCLDGLINQRRKAVATFLTWQMQTPAPVREQVGLVFKDVKELPLPVDTAQLCRGAGPVSERIDRIGEEKYFFNLTRFRAKNSTLTRPDDGSYIVLIGRDSTYVVAARPLRPYSVPEPVPSSGYYTDVFQAQISKEFVRPGRYRMGILTYEKGAVRFGMTPQILHQTTQL
ncbi:hypothetical protein [Tellurirhabdus rosea]|uniref:hypothetical protein n=1 Tax=Tellurirhabdus rosea TaxID=2674997 RepID=UPI00224CB7E7|nr:hypothetical protein [Tellurirhabdus rosea]